MSRAERREAERSSERLARKTAKLCADLGVKLGTPMPFADAQASILKLAGQGVALHMTILHDDDCPEMYQRGACACTPDFALDVLTTDAYMAGEKAERAWRKPS